LRTLSKLLSWVFHPLFILTYVLILLMYANPFLFGFTSIADGLPQIFTILFSTALIPGIAVILMSFLNLIKDINLIDKIDRTGPFIIAGIFYLWLFQNLQSHNNFPEHFTGFVLGSTICLFICFVLNIVFKVSVHAAAMAGGLVMLIISHSSGLLLNGVQFGSLYMPDYLLISIAILLTGLVGYARLKLVAHTLSQVFLGYLVGIVSVIAGMMIYMK